MILNLTQHPATPEQKAAGVVDPDLATFDLLKKRLTFEHPPTEDEMFERAEQIAFSTFIYTKDWPSPIEVMIGGAPYFLPYLVRELEEDGIEALHAFSKRVSEEQPQPDGSVRKVTTFKHICFVPAT